MHLPSLLTALTPLLPSLPAQALPQEAPLGYGAFHWGDANADGLQDAYVLLASGEAQLLLNQGDGRFRDGTLESGLEQAQAAQAVLWADLDGDSRQDLVLGSRSQGAQVWLQASAGVFRLLPSAGAWSEQSILGLQAFDYDGDLRLDLQLQTGAGEMLLRGLGGARFERVATATGGTLPLGSAADLGDGAEGDSGDELDLSLNAGGATSQPPGDGLESNLFCPPTVQDQATGSCLPASSVPTLGALYPLGEDFFIDVTGRVGIGTTNPQQSLDVQGSVRASARLFAGATAGPPLVVESTSRVANLNADLLDGQHASAFSQFGTEVDGSEIADGAVNSSKISAGAVTGAHISNGTIGDADISNSASIAGSKVDPSFGAQPLLAGSVASSTYVDAGFGTDASPSFRFSPTEPTGLASPVGNAVYVITNAVVAARFLFGGQVILGSSPDSEVNINPQLDIVSVGGTIAQNYKLQSQIEVYPGGLVISNAVAGNNNATTGVARGVSGLSHSDGGTGVDGFAAAYSGETYGVSGTSRGSSGGGVRGRYFVDGFTMASYGLVGVADGSGMRGVTQVPFSTGVVGVAEPATGPYSDGVRGEAYGGSGYGVYGINSSGGYGVFAGGDLGATGTKTFVQPHPQDPAQEIRFVCLEGNESGTYFRGQSRLTEGRTVIEVPEEFRLVSEEDNITVQLTPRGPVVLWVESVDLDRIVVRGATDVDFDYFVNGVRRGFRDIQLVRENRAFRPSEVGLPFGEHLDPELRDLLVENGTLNADYTPNLETAARLGWQLAPAGTRARTRELSESQHGPDGIELEVPKSPEPRPRSSE